MISGFLFYNFIFKYFIYFYIFYIYLYKNVNFLDYYDVLFNLNKNLTNGLLVIHPIVLYFSYAYFLFILSYMFNCYYNFLNYNLFITFNKKYLLNLLSCLTTSIFLGSWWAEQELNWGGWWSWDLIEIISLNLFLIICFVIHSKKYNVVLNFCYLDFIYKFILYFFIVRFNFLTSIHNFISNNFFFQYIFIFLLFFCLNFFIILKIKHCNTLLFKESRLFNTINMIFYSFLISFIIYIYLEFFSLFFYSFNIVDVFKKNKYMFIYILYFFLFSNFLFSNYIVINVFFLNIFEFYYLIFLYKDHNKKSKKPVYFFHILFYFSIFILLFNFYYIDVLFKKPFNLITINLNEVVFLNYFKLFLTNFTTNSINYKDFIFSKLLFFYKNILIEIFSFNNFISFIININVFFYIGLFANAHLYYYFWMKSYIYF